MKKYLLALPSSLFVSLWHYSWYKQNKAFSTKSFFTLRTSSLKLFILPVSFFFFFPVELSYLCNTESPFLIKITTESQFTVSISFLNVYCLFEQMEKKGSKCSALLQVIPDCAMRLAGCWNAFLLFISDSLQNRSSQSARGAHWIWF